MLEKMEALKNLPKRLDVGSRREVNVFDGRGGDQWIPGTVLDFEDGDSRNGKASAVVFDLDRADWQGSKQAAIRLPGGSYRLRRITA